MKKMGLNVFQRVIHPVPSGSAPPLILAPVKRGTVGLSVRRKDVQGGDGEMGAL